MIFWNHLHNAASFNKMHLWNCHKIIKDFEENVPWVPTLFYILLCRIIHLTRWLPRHPYLCDGYTSMGTRHPCVSDALLVRVNQHGTRARENIENVKSITCTLTTTNKCYEIHLWTMSNTDYSCWVCGLVLR